MQLLEVRQQLTSELEHLTQSYAQLRLVQSRFKACLEALSHFQPSRSLETPTLIPLTSSLYVPGKLKDVQNVLVDVGTGYYVEKTRDQAEKMYKEKVVFVSGNLEKLQGTMERKQDNLRVVGEVLQMVSSPLITHDSERKETLTWLPLFSSSSSSLLRTDQKTARGQQPQQQTA